MDRSGATAPYNYGDVVTLTSNAATGWAFDHWSGDLTGTDDPDDVTIDGNKTVTAHFTCDPCSPGRWSAAVTVEKWWWEDASGNSGARADISGTVNLPDCLTGEIDILLRLEVFTNGWGYKGTTGEVLLTLPGDNPFSKILGFGYDVDNASYNSIKKYKLMIKPDGCEDWIEIDSGDVSVKAGY